MEKFVVDTNFFINLEIKTGLGNSSSEVVESFVSLAKQIKEKKAGEFFMPPKIVEEFVSFFEGKDLCQNLISVITIKSPDINKINFNANLFYQLIAEVRERAYRGLRIAEESVKKAGKRMMGINNLTQIDFERAIGEIVKNLRERYRQATRFNFIDSVADLDLIVLTKEIDGFLISSDEGVIRWGRLFGVKEMPPNLLKTKLLSLLNKETSHQA